MNCILCGCWLQQYDRRDRICDPCRKNMAASEDADEKARKHIQSQLDELKRFREREPLVQQLLSDIEDQGFASNEQMESYSRLKMFELHTPKTARDLDRIKRGGR